MEFRGSAPGEPNRKEDEQSAASTAWIASRRMSFWFNKRTVRSMALTGLYLFFTMVLAGPIMSGGAEAGEGNPARQAGYFVAFLLTLVAGRPIQNPRILLVVPPSLLLVIAWCLLSLSWSQVPEIAARRLTLTALVIWTVFMSVRQLGFETVTRALLGMLLTAIIASYVAVVLFPRVGIHQFDVDGDPGLIGDWRGIMPGKNVTGEVCAYAIILLLTLKRLSAIMRLGGVVTAGFFLLMTGSKTSLAVLIPALVTAWALRRYDVRFRALLLPLLMVTGCAMVLAISHFLPAFLEYLSRPDALTGRAQIWPLLFEYASQHLMLGSGYGSFWNSGEVSPLAGLSTKAWLLKIDSGHNGYLDVLVQVGAPGLSLVIAACFVSPLAKLLGSRFITSQSRSTAAGLLIFALGHEFTESSLIDRDQLGNVMLMIAIAVTSISVQEGRTSLLGRAVSYRA